MNEVVRVSLHLRGLLDHNERVLLQEESGLQRVVDLLEERVVLVVHWVDVRPLVEEGRVLVQQSRSSQH